MMNEGLAFRNRWCTHVGSHDSNSRRTGASLKLRPRPPSPLLFSQTAGNFHLWALAFLAITLATWVVGTLKLVQFCSAGVAAPDAAAAALQGVVGGSSSSSGGGGSGVYGYESGNMAYRLSSDGLFIDDGNGMSAGAAAGVIVVERTGLVRLVLVEAVWFVLGFVALCTAAFCLTLETCDSARRRVDVWAKYSKEV